MDGIHENDGIGAFQGSLLPFPDDGKNLVRDSADGAIRYLYAVNVTDVSFDIRCRHSFGVHGQNLFFNVLTDAGLILLEQLRLKLSLPIPRGADFHVSEAGFQLLAAVTIPGVVCFLVAEIIFAVTEFFIQLRFQSVLHKFCDGLLEQALDICHAGDVGFLQQLANLGTPCVFFRSPVLSRHTHKPPN